MIPWLYTPMLDQPTSSPMMKIMFGFLSCAGVELTHNKNKQAVTNRRNTHRCRRNTDIFLYPLSASMGGPDECRPRSRRIRTTVQRKEGAGAVANSYTNPRGVQPLSFFQPSGLRVPVNF